MPRGVRRQALIERARAQVAAAFGAEGADIVFTSGATEAAALACAGRELQGSAIEHDAVLAWVADSLSVGPDGQVTVADPARSVLQMANSETGIVQSLPEGLAVTDATQAFGKLPVAFNWCGAQAALISAHKLGGPKGVGALVLRRGQEIPARIRGGGQEMGRRAGTENVIGIAGFGAAAEAAARATCGGCLGDGRHDPRSAGGGPCGIGKEDYFCRKRCRTAAQHLVFCHARLEGRDAGDADGPGRLRDMCRVRLFQRQGARQPRAAGDGSGRDRRGQRDPGVAGAGHDRDRRACDSPRRGLRRNRNTAPARRDVRRWPMAALDKTQVKEGVDQDTVDAVREVGGAYKHGWNTDIEMEYAPKGLTAGHRAADLGEERRAGMDDRLAAGRL